MIQLLVLLTALQVGDSPGIVGPRPGPLNVVMTARSQNSVPRQAVVYNWQEPALIGGALLGTFTNFIAYGFCSSGEGSSSRDQCALGSEVGFLVGATVGGGIAGLIGSTSKRASAPAGFVYDGDRRVHGALMLLIPPLAVDTYGFLYQCNHQYLLSRENGCNAGNLVIALMSAALNGWIGAQIGKGIPAYRRVE